MPIIEEKFHQKKQSKRKVLDYVFLKYKCVKSRLSIIINLFFKTDKSPFYVLASTLFHLLSSRVFSVKACWV
jgi:hypothetical protein